MRDIKFRMWNNVKDNPSSSRMFYDVEQVMECLKQQVYSDTEKSVRGYNHIADGNSFMQSTGLKDANGKGIYEGDIVKCWDNAADDPSWRLDKHHTGVICFNPPQFTLKIPGKLTYDGGAVKHWDNDVFLNEWDNAENIEIIGNIHENPKLLTQNK